MAMTVAISCSASLNRSTDACVMMFSSLHKSDYSLFKSYIILYNRSQSIWQAPWEKWFIRFIRLEVKSGSNYFKHAIIGEDISSCLMGILYGSVWFTA